MLDEVPLSALQVCNINYEKDELKVKFEASSMWTLKKLIICFNDSFKKSHDFGISGFQSRGLFNAIEIGLHVADMNIMYYSALEKVFYIEIHYSTGGSNERRDLISL